MHRNINVAVGGPVNADYQKTYKTVFLKPAIPFALQVTDEDTKYVIKHNFDLGGESVTIPAGCILDFDGGCISNGTLVGHNTCIEAELFKIFNTDVTLTGSWNVEEAYPEWFGTKGDGETNDTDNLQRCIDFACENHIAIQLNKKRYYIQSGGLKVKSHLHLYSKINSVLFTKSGLQKEDYYPFILGCTFTDTDPLVDINGYGFEDVIIEGIIFDQSAEEYEPDSYVSNADFHGGDCIFIYGCKDVKIVNCTFYLKGSNAVQIGRYTNSNVIVSNNLVYNCVRNTYHDQSAIYVESQYASIINNIIVDKQNVAGSTSGRMDGGIEIHGIGITASGNIINNVNNAFNVTYFRGVNIIAPDRNKTGQNIIEGNTAYCSTFVALWNQGTNNEIVIRNLFLTNNSVKCKRAFALVPNRDFHREKIDGIYIKGNVFNAVEIESANTQSSLNAQSAIYLFSYNSIENIIIENNNFSSYSGQILCAQGAANNKNLSFSNNKMYNCFNNSREKITVKEYIPLIEVSSMWSDSKICGNEVTISEDADIVSAFITDKGNDSIIKDNVFPDTYNGKIYRSKASVYTYNSLPTYGMFVVGDRILTNEGEYYVTYPGSKRDTVLAGTLHTAVDSYIELTNGEIKVGDTVILTTTNGVYSSKHSKVFAVVGNRCYLSEWFTDVEHDYELSSISLQEFTMTKINTSNVPALYSTPSSKKVGDQFINLNNNKVYIWSTFAWLKVAEYPETFKIGGTNSEKPQDASYLQAGYTYYMTDIHKLIVYEGLYNGGQQWVDAFGETASYKRSGSTQERPTNSSWEKPMSVGFQYFDTTLGKPIWWNGTAWVDATGATV